MSFQDEIDQAPGEVIEGSGYSVKVCLGWGTIKYTRAGRSILVTAELVDKTRELGRSWLILPTYALAITTPAVLRWDDGAQLDSEESNKIRTQIASALRKSGRKYFFEIGERSGERRDR